MDLLDALRAIRVIERPFGDIAAVRILGPWEERGAARPFRQRIQIPTLERALQYFSEIFCHCMGKQSLTLMYVANIPEHGGEAVAAGEIHVLNHVRLLLVVVWIKVIQVGLIPDRYTIWHTERLGERVSENDKCV